MLKKDQMTKELLNGNPSITGYPVNTIHSTHSVLHSFDLVNFSAPKNHKKHKLPTLSTSEYLQGCTQIIDFKPTSPVGLKDSTVWS